MRWLLPALMLGFAAIARARELAITVDDLPVHNALPPGETRLSVAERMIAVLKDAKVPEPYGFVNAGPIDENPSLQAVLTAWRAAGFRLGNHTWSHADLDKCYQATDPSRISGGTPRVLSGTSLMRAAWPAMTRPASPELERSYLAAALQAGDDARRLSPGIPYVLLMHVGAFDARMMPKLLAQYRRQGFHFVTLPQAERDYDDAVRPPLAPAAVDSDRLAKLCTAQ